MLTRHRPQVRRVTHTHLIPAPVLEEMGHMGSHGSSRSRAKTRRKKERWARPHSVRKPQAKPTLRVRPRWR
eukprot:2199338-Prymnesium_polylepis.1